MAIIGQIFDVGRSYLSLTP